MTKIIPQTLKGFRDFLPEEALKRQNVIAKLRLVFTRFGFEPLETPALEYAQVLEGKYGAAGEKLIYKFEDRGGRKVALRYDQTVPLARVISQYTNQIPLPFRRYQIQPVWRAENPQKGRYREFLQCDADIVDSDSVAADLEILSCLNACLKELGFKEFQILVNSRQIFDQLKLKPQVIALLDKEEKVGQSETIRQLTKIIGSESQALSIYSSLKNFPLKDLPSRLKILLQQSQNLNLVFSPLLARGLDYYTDLIFEVKIPQYSGGSICGGGRYDNLIGYFGNQKIPAVGFAFGFDRLVEALEQLQLLSVPKTTTQILVTIFSPDLLNQSLTLANLLRQNDFKTSLYPDENAKLDKQIKYADRQGIPYVVILGPEEIKNNSVTVKNLKTKEQKTINIEKLKEFLISQLSVC